MNKKIALIIEKIVTQSPYNFFHCEVIENDTQGFWKCVLKFENRDNAHSEALVRSLHYIGLVFGESLNIQDRGNIVEVD